MERSERRAFTVWFSIFADLRGSILATSLASLLALTCSTARADLLLYDGFATATDAQGRTPYLSTSDTHKLQSDNAKGAAWTTGLSSSYPWSDASAVVFTFRNNGLSLPDAFADGTGGQFTARGGSVGWLNSSDPSEIRGKNRKITSAMPTSGTLYYRCLMKIETAAFSKMKDYADRYAAAGLTCRAAENKYDNGSAMTQAGFRVRFVGTGSTVALHFDVGKGDGNGMTENTLIGSVTAGTTYLCIVGIDYSEGTACAYAAPIADYDKSFAWTVEDVDASGITGSAVQTMFVDGIYQTNGGRVLVDEIAAGTELGDVAVYTPSGAPQLGTVSLARTGAATYSVSAEESENTADTMSWIANDGASVPATNSFATAVVAGTTETGTISNLTADKTYQISVLAENANGADEKTAGVIYTGALSLGATTDANEYGLVAGGVTVSRAAADPLPLTVNYTISGSAGAEGTTWAAPVAVTIPANEASATLPVVPLMDGDVTSDITITVALAAGNYELPSSNAATLTLLNLAAPAGKKTWVATANGNASDGANWIPAGAPAASDHILFDGNFSNARCIWDAAATHTVASWTQEGAFTGTVELQTTYESGAFAALAVTEDCTISGGTMTQTGNSNAQTYRLSLTVGGDFTVASGATVTASNKGYAPNSFPVGAAIGVHGGSINDLSKVYGDFKHPVDLGAGGGFQGMTGGGAIHIVVTGDATIDGTLAANPNQGSATTDQLGAGGSIYLQAASVSGSGSVTTAGTTSSDSATRQFGAGGRIAVICTTANELAFPKANFRCNGSTGSYGRSSGGGTIFVKTASQQNGTLIVAHNVPTITYVRWYPTKRGATPIPAGEAWTLDAIEFRGYGILCVPEGTSLSVPLSGISSTSGTRTGGILYEGGTLNFGSAPYTLTGNWTFCADTPYTFDGDVTVTGGANLGGFKYSGNYKTDFAKCDITVDGDLTIASGGFASVELAGPWEANVADGKYPFHGGQYALYSVNKAYGSVFEPMTPGYFSQGGNDHGDSHPGAGVLKLTVTGDLAVDGKVSANGVNSGNPSASAGSVNIRARTISGSGTISATGEKAANYQYANRPHGAGGRVSVRVTDEEVGTSGIWAKIAARGSAKGTTGKDWDVNTSAGTVYLQGKSDGEKGGTIYVKNQASADTSDVATWIPAASRGDSAADFANAKLVIADRGVVAIGAANMKLAALTIESNSRLDLHGETLRVKRATVGGVRLAPGMYAAGDEAVSGFVADSGEGGKLVVTATGLSIIIR